MVQRTYLGTSNQPGVFLWKSSPRTKHNWHSSIGFLINNAPRNVYLILHYHLFFLKEFFSFECLCFSEYDIRMFLIVFWSRNSCPLSMYAFREMEGVIQNLCSCAQGERVITPHVYVRTYTISFHVFVLRCLVLFVEI